jgi:hypothetical protein
VIACPDANRVQTGGHTVRLPVELAVGELLGAAHDRHTIGRQPRPVLED